MERTETEVLADALAPLLARVRVDATAVKVGQGHGFWPRHAEPLTPERLTAHLEGGTRRGVALIRPGEAVVSVAVLDLDDHHGAAGWDRMVAVALRVRVACEQAGMVPTLVRSSGGRGVQAWLLWDTPQDAHSVRVALRRVVEGPGLREGTGGVAAGQVEIFPKQDRVREGGYGNLVWLPLAGESRPLGPDGAVLEREAAAEWVWEGSSDVPVVEREAIGPRGGVELDEVAFGVLGEALAWLVRVEDWWGYDHWIRAGMALHWAYGGDEEGLGLWDSVSRQVEGYEGYEDLVRKWATFGLRGEADDVVTEGWVLKEARAAGWVEDVSGAFEPVAEDGETSLPKFARTKEGVIKATLGNLVLALEDLRYTGGWVLSEDRFLGLPGVVVDGVWRERVEVDLATLRHRLEKVGFAPISQQNLMDAARIVEVKGGRDCAGAWLEGLRWDGVPRVEGFLEAAFERVDHEAGWRRYARAVSRYLWTALAGRVLDGGCQADMVPILVGAQGCGKTSVLQLLAPWADAFAEVGFHLKDVDLCLAVQGRIVCELSELRGLRTAELETVKAWVTRRVDRYRAPYARLPVARPRRFVAVGTTNEDAFLGDATGNRRWLPVEVGKARLDWVAAWREQLWAEAAVLWLVSGVDWEEAATLGVEQTRQYETEDAWEELVKTYCSRRTGPFTVLEIGRSALFMDPEKIGKSETMRMATILKRAGFYHKRRMMNGKRCHFWHKPAPF